MPLEDLVGTRYIADLNEVWPLGVDLPNAGDDHLRGIKNILKRQFPNLGRVAVTLTADQINRGSVPSGSITTFYSAVAPVGWTRQVVDNIFMLRIIPSSDNSGGSGGGTDDPTFNAKVPSHVHGFSASTGEPSLNHTHYVSGNTTAQSAYHKHHVEGQTGAENRFHTHTVNTTGQTGAGLYATGNNFYFGAAQDRTVSLAGSGTTSGESTTHEHFLAIDSGFEDVSHVHGVGLTTTGQSGGHTHAVYGTVDGNAGAGFWAPRYLNFIVCVRN